MRIFKKLLPLLCVAALICTISLPSFAAGTVSYSADSEKFIFAPGSTHSPTDLFTEYKGLMPGDSVKQEITVKNDSSYNAKVKLYVRSLGAAEDSEEFLSKLHLTVAKAEDNEMAYMFDAPANETDGMSDWVYLGTLYSGGVVDLELELDIPIDLDDRFQDAIGYINWEFKAEMLPVEPSDPRPPQTGDNTPFYAFAMIASVCVAALVIFLPKLRKEREDS